MIFDWPTWEIDYEAMRAQALRAMSENEMRQREIAQLAAAMNYQPTLADMNAMQNYRRPAYVPQGFVDWYACGDELT